MQKMETRKQPIGRTAAKCGGKILISVTALLAVATLLVFSLHSKTNTEERQTAATAAIFDDPLAVVLAPQTGDSRTDRPDDDRPDLDLTRKADTTKQASVEPTD